MRISHAVCLLVSGIAIGWMVGLSVSPVLEAVLTGLLGVVASLLALLSGLPEDNTRGDAGAKRLAGVRPNPVPVTILIVAVALGAIGGIYVRTRDLLGVGIVAQIRELEAAGIPRLEINRYILNGRSEGKHDDAKTTPPTEGVLYKGPESPEVSRQILAHLPNATSLKDILDILDKNVQKPHIRELVSKLRKLPASDTSAVLKVVVEDLICTRNLQSP